MLQNYTMYTNTWHKTNEMKWRHSCHDLSPPHKLFPHLSLIQLRDKRKWTPKELFKGPSHILLEKNLPWVMSEGNGQGRLRHNSSKSKSRWSACWPACKGGEAASFKHNSDTAAMGIHEWPWACTAETRCLKTKDLLLICRKVLSC